MVWISGGDRIRLAHAKERKEGKQQEKKELTQHFLEFKAQSWNGKSKHIYVRQTAPIRHQAGQTGHRVSRWGLSSLRFLPCVCPSYYINKSIHVQIYRPHLQQWPVFNNKREWIKFNQSKWEKLGSWSVFDPHTKHIKISDSSYLSDANNGSQKQFVTIFPVQNDSLLCLSMTHFTNVAYCSATLSYIPVSGAWSGVSMRLSSHRPIWKGFGLQ